MRRLFVLLLISVAAWGQTVNAPTAAAGVVQPNLAPKAQAQSPSSSNIARRENTVIIPAGAKVPLSLQQAISTKNAREGDPVYASTVFPFVLNDHILIPAGTYIQGKITHTERAGHGKGRAEILIHFTTLIYPSGYTVMLPASLQNTPGADDHDVKDKEGTIQQDKNTGSKVEEATKDAAVAGTAGAIAGAAAGGLNGVRYGGLAGLGAGVAWALLKRGPDVKLEVGSSIEMEIQRDIPVDASRIQVVKAGS
ncbi:MAG TPA: hypothetical protein VMX38_11265 [Verrucomicrobiae bacterium]|jgi:hypothetical protein|nr:hypothetical protein [Verrucomicrobiae bacterium]